ncbi:TIGR03773 family transporter-associated surface protein [Corynebacterium urogenitale]
MGRTFQHFTSKQRVITAAFSAVTALGLATAPALPVWDVTTGTLSVIENPLISEAGAQTVRFDQGHVDAFNVTVEKGKLVLDLKEDITGSHVRHDPEGIELRVKAEAFTTATETVNNVKTAGYLLPQTQNQNLLWPGWDTLGVKGSGYEHVDIEFTDVSGPGRVFLFGDDLNGLSPLLKDGSFELTSGDIREQKFAAHTHANWVFEKSGQYTMTVKAKAKNEKGQSLTSEEKTYTWVVDHSPEDPNEAGTVDQAVANTPVDTGNDGEADGGDNGGASEGAGAGNTGGANSGTTGGTTGGGKSSSQGTSSSKSGSAKSSSGSSTSQTKAGNSAATGGGNSTGGDAAQCTKGEPGLRPLIKDDRQSPPKWVSPSSVNFGLGGAAKAQLPQKLGPIAQGEAWLIGATQQPGVPWLGVNTMHPNLLSKTTGDVTFALTSFEGPGNMFVYEQGNLGQVVGSEWFSGSNGKASGSHVVPRNSHVHPNWVFDKPGTYRVGITQTATTKEGKKVSAPATLTFSVGGSGGNATSGHFDLGAEITEDGNCSGGAGDAGGAGGAGGVDGADGSGANADGSLANTGASTMTLAIIVAGLGVAVLGGGLLTYLRSMKSFKA